MLPRPGNPLILLASLFRGGGGPRRVRAGENAPSKASLVGCAVSSVVEHYLDTVGVTGSNPVSRTIFNRINGFISF